MKFYKNTILLVFAIFQTFAIQGMVQELKSLCKNAWSVATFAHAENRKITAYKASLQEIISVNDQNDSKIINAKQFSWNPEYSDEKNTAIIKLNSLQDPTNGYNNLYKRVELVSTLSAFLGLIGCAGVVAAGKDVDTKIKSGIFFATGAAVATAVGARFADNQDARRAINLEDQKASGLAAMKDEYELVLTSIPIADDLSTYLAMVSSPDDFEDVEKQNRMHRQYSYPDQNLDENVNFSHAFLSGDFVQCKNNLAGFGSEKQKEWKQIRRKVEDICVDLHDTLNILNK
jgi:hypothetical protein